MTRLFCHWAFVFCISGYAFCGTVNQELEHAIIKGAKVLMKLHVVDDDGNPVAEAKVQVLLGMNFREKANFLNGYTSSRGQFMIEGKTTGNEVEITVSKDGYYRSNECICLITRPGSDKVINGKWQPFGEKRIVRLRKIRHPIHLIRFEKKHVCTRNQCVAGVGP